jgi:uncharacterized membrane protein YfcA
MQKMQKKGQTTGILTGLLAAVATFAVVIIMTSISADVVDRVQDTQTANSFAFNVSQDGLSGFDNLSGFYPNIGLVIAATALIGILIGGFAVFATLRS